MTITVTCADCGVPVKPGNGLQPTGQAIIPLCVECITKRIINYKKKKGT